MGQKKLIRFEAIKQFKNVLEFPNGMQGQWHLFFKNNCPIVLELACGKGEYTLALARKNPSINYIGIDIKGNRIWKGASTALEENMENVAFLRISIENIIDYFAPNEIDEIWITFPDPHPRISRIKKRLTHPKFLKLYQSILTKNGTVHLKTDAPDLYFFTLAIIDLFQLELLLAMDSDNPAYATIPALNITTHYEGLNLSKSQKNYYLSFRANNPFFDLSEPELKTILEEKLNTKKNLI